MGLFSKTVGFTDKTTVVNDIGDMVDFMADSENGKVGAFYLHFPILVDDDTYYKLVARSTLLKDSGYRNIAEFKASGDRVYISARVEQNLDMTLELELHRKNEMDAYDKQYPLDIVRCRLPLHPKEKEDLYKLFDAYIQKGTGDTLKDYMAFLIRQEELDRSDLLVEYICLDGDGVYEPSSNSMTFPISFRTSLTVSDDLLTELFLDRCGLPEALGFKSGHDMYQSTQHMDALHTYLTLGKDVAAKKSFGSIEISFEDNLNATSRSFVLEDEERFELEALVHRSTGKRIGEHLSEQRKKQRASKGIEM